MSKKCLNGFEMSKAESLIVEFFNNADAVQVEEGAWYYSESSVNSELLEAYTQLAKANERIAELNKDVLEEIENRDNREEWLDKLSDEISRYLGVDIGEHSSANNPWREALDSIPEGTLNKFAIEKKIEGATLFASSANETGQFGWSDCQWLSDYAEEFAEQLRKEQDGE